MEDLQQININQNARFASFDLSNMYTNIPTQEIFNIITLICKQNQIDENRTKNLLTITETILQQNYFQFQGTVYTQNEGLAMGAPTSTTLSEVYLQYLEHTILYDIHLHHHIISYYRYVDDILLFFYTHITNIQGVLQEFNTVHPKLQFTLEEEVNNRLNFLDITIIRSNDSIQSNIYRKPMATNTFIPADSCHPNEHIQSTIRFLNHRNTTYLTTPEHKQHEALVINHIR
jgi:hypothetical protein